MTEQANSSHTHTYAVATKYVSDEAVLLFKWIVVVAVCEVLDVLCSITNIINIVCILKQGFNEPINVSLFGKLTSKVKCLIC